MRRILVAVVAAVSLVQVVGYGQAQGKMLKGSLGIYLLLTDADFKADSTIENRAQSLTAFKVGRDRIVQLDEGTSTR